MYDLITCGGLFLTTSLYALLLERLQKRYEPRWTWLTVVIGCLMICTFVGLRLMLPLSDLPSAAMAWHVWALFLWHFAAGGLPIIIWQIWQDRQMLLKALERARKGRHD